MERLTAAVHGDGGMVLVAGEPGIGKTRLLAELAAHAGATGTTVLAGRAYDSEGMPPYLPVVEALRDGVRRSTVEHLPAVLGVGAAQVALLVPELQARFPDLDLPLAPAIGTDQERYRLFESVTDFLLAVAGAAPDSPPQTHEAGTPPSASAHARGALLLLDDLQWADTPTLLLVLHLARRLAGSRLLVVGAYRPTDLDRTHPLSAVLADLRRERLAERLPLAALTREDVGDLIAGLNGAPATPAVVDAISRETDGNAFFAEEVVQHLLSEGRDLADAEAAVGDWGIPEGVREVIGRRLSRLSDAANRLLTVTAVLGDGVSFAVLRTACDLEAGQAEETLDEVLGAGLLREEGAAYAFSHALIRQTVYEELRLPRRQRLHLQAAQALEQVYGQQHARYLPQIAAHYRAAGAAADADTVIAACQQAGAAAAATFAWEDAITNFEGALELVRPDQQADRFELLLALGDARMQAGDRAQARELFQQAATLGRTTQMPEWVARAALAYSGLRFTPAAVEQSVIDFLHEALAALPTADSALRARLLARLAMERRFDEVQARSTALSQTAIDMAERTGDRLALSIALRAKELALMLADDLEAQAAVIAACAQLAREMGSHEFALQTNYARVWNCLQRGDIEVFDALLADTARMAQETRHHFFLWWTLLYRAMRALLVGELGACEQLAEEALVFGQRMGIELVPRAYNWQLVALRREQGRLAEVAADVDRRAERYTEYGARVDLPILYFELGRRDQAVQLFEELTDPAHPVRRFQLEPSPQSALAEACYALDDQRRAARLYDRLLPYAARIPGIAPADCVCRGSVARYLGLLATTLGRWDAAGAHFDNALVLHERMGARPLLAHTQRQYAAMLLRRHGRGDLVHARELVERAGQLYRDVGMDPWAAIADALLRDPGPTQARATVPSYPNGLSEREVQVLCLLAAGKTNKEIADTLVISINTVMRHVAHIFAKTGAANRAEAATYAARHGLTT